MKNYLYILITSSNESDYPFYLVSSFEKAYSKGISLFIVINYFFFLFLISFYKTILIDPGCFYSANDIEIDLVYSQIKHKESISSIDFKIEEEKSNLKSKSELNLENIFLSSKDVNSLNDISLAKYISRVKFLNSFNSYVQQGPLTSDDYRLYNSSIVRHLNVAERIKNKENIVIDHKTFDINNLESYFKEINISKSIFCGNCLRYKVERSHHCRQCGRCILKMDHHCPWLANCIGFKNYKYFLLIEIYGLLTIIPIICTYWEAVISYNASRDSSFFICYFTTFSFFIAVGLLGFMIWLVILNWKLVFTGQTIIEYSDRERFPMTKNTNIYDLGYYRNFCVVFGNNPLIWFFPFSANDDGKGIVFETIYSSLGN